jgi:hypothetical protein
LNTIEYQALPAIINRLMTHMRATASITNDKGGRIHLRQTGDPEPLHLEVYQMLGLPPKLPRPNH